MVVFFARTVAILTFFYKTKHSANLCTFRLTVSGEHAINNEAPNYNADAICKNITQVIQPYNAYETNQSETERSSSMAHETSKNDYFCSYCQQPLNLLRAVLICTGIILIKLLIQLGSNYRECNYYYLLSANKVCLLSYYLIKKKKNQ